MDAAMPDVRQTVEYSRDGWTMRKVPLALLLCLAGLFIVVRVAPGLPHPGVLAVFVALLSAWLLWRIAWEMIWNAATARQRWLVAGLIVLGLLAVVALAGVADGLRTWSYPSKALDYRGRPSPPANILGWMVVLGSVGWIGFALVRHFVPTRPLLVLSPAGITYRGAALKGGLLIPWHEIHAVDGLEVIGPSGYPLRNDDLTVVLVSRAFHEEHILPRRPSMPIPDWDRLFVPKGALVQVPLPYAWFSIEPRLVREPVEVRWKAFRDARTSSALPAGGSSPQTTRVYGTWSIDGSLWQATTFLVPLLGIVALLVTAAGLWPG
jgi:hypothetical protein